LSNFPIRKTGSCSGRKRDALGLPKVEIHWRWRPLDQNNLVRLHAILIAELEQSNLGRVELVLSKGEMVRSTLPTLAGLSVRGSWIPDFEELVRFAEREIPPEAGLLMIPGEDLFYYTTGRHPCFAVLMFDHTVNPYSPDEILELVRARKISWLIVKQNLQLEGEPVEDKNRLLALLRQDFEQMGRLNNYDVYRRRSTEDSRDDQMFKDLKIGRRDR